METAKPTAVLTAAVLFMRSEGHVTRRAGSLKGFRFVLVFGLVSPAVRQQSDPQNKSDKTGRWGFTSGLGYARMTLMNRYGEAQMDTRFQINAYRQVDGRKVLPGLQSLTVSARLDTVEEAQAVAAMFPKSAGLQAHRVTAYRGSTADGTFEAYYYGGISMTVQPGTEWHHGPGQRDRDAPLPRLPAGSRQARIRGCVGGGIRQLGQDRGRIRGRSVNTDRKGRHMNADREPVYAYWVSQANWGPDVWMPINDSPRLRAYFIDYYELGERVMSYPANRLG